MTLTALILATAVSAEPVDFSRDVRPLLSERCFACHGADDRSRKAGLRLDTRAGAVGRAESGAVAVAPGKPAASELLRRVTLAAADGERMPPTKSGPPLKAAEVEILRRWIAAGAEYKEHWAFAAPKTPPLPPVRNAAWPRQPLDRFILARLENSGLAPSPEADRRTLARRWALDLIGLPPAPKQVADFLADTRPGAEERYVDRLLADPAFGERWARVWLDLARYADSAGYGSDPLRPFMFRYRDWVVDAFNRNEPFDRFTIKQLAGDLLPGANDDDRLATAFHRNTMTNTEGGTDDEEFRVAAVKDRVNVTMQVWMGFTAGCAQCHSHKYDPLSQREYYQLFAFFNQTADNDDNAERPLMPAPTAAQRRSIAEIDGKIAALRKRLPKSPAKPTEGAKTGSLPPLRGDGQAGSLPPLRGDGQAGSLPPLRGDGQASSLPPLRGEGQGGGQGRKSADVASAPTSAEKQLADEIAALEKTRPKPTEVPVMVALPAGKRRKTHLLEKGNFLNPGAEVQALVPAAFHPLPDARLPDRLALAKWLLDERNPLTARVAANRWWARLFGKGLVETEEDFGTQGEPPSHPELLDWLAGEYRRLGWDTKAFLKMIVLSATYRQSSAATPALLERDPRNRLLARAPRFRLEAEAVRDQALALSGLLSRKIGGPSVFPAQPPGLWQAAFNGERTWATSAGDDRHRRGLYTFWRRTVPYPSMATFDAPSRETCTLRRSNTNTPLQAFVTLNDPVYVECAQALARRLVKEGGAAPADRAAFGLRLCTGREADPKHAVRLAALYESELARFRKDEAAAKKLATEPLGPLPAGMDAAELAAWTVVANVLLNLDAVLTKG